MDNNTSRNLSTLGRVLTISSQLAAGVVGGYFAGAYLDTKLGTGPWLSILLLTLGVAGGLKAAYDSMSAR